jgi:hypothetical protein
MPSRFPRIAETCAHRNTLIVIFLPKLYHIRTRKHFPRFFISPAARQLGIDHGVSDRGVPYPVLHKAEVCTGVEQVGGDRVLEGMEMSLAFRDAGAVAAVFDKLVESAAADGRSVA